LHVLSRIQLALTTLPWSRNRVFLGRPLLVALYWKTMNSFWPLKQFRDKLYFASGPPVWIICSQWDITYAVFRDMISIHYWNLIKNITVVIEKIVILRSVAHLKSPCFWSWNDLSGTDLSWMNGIPKATFSLGGGGVWKCVSPAKSRHRLYERIQIKVHSVDLFLKALSLSLSLFVASISIHTI
jgi:hypothetical protein